MFNGPDIEKLIKDDEFVDSMNDLVLHIWTVFDDVVKKNFLCNRRAENYKYWKSCRKVYQT